MDTVARNLASSMLGQFGQTVVLRERAKDIPRTPTPEWRLKVGSRWYGIVHVKTSYSGDEGCVHQLVARGSDDN
jgi:hypothetical protein